MPLRIVIVDDQRIFRDGLCAQFDFDDNFEVVGQYANAADAVAAVLRLRPDITLMDLQLPKTEGERASHCGASAIKQIKNSWPKATIVVVTMYEDAEQAREALAAGVCGYLLKSDERTDYAQVLPQIASGQCVFDRHIVDFLPTIVSNTTNGRYPFRQLTRRENEILDLATRGLSNHEIARELNLSRKTVANRFADIFSKLDVANRNEAVQKGQAAGLGQDGEFPENRDDHTSGPREAGR